MSSSNNSKNTTSPATLVLWLRRTRCSWPRQWLSSVSVELNGVSLHCLGDRLLLMPSSSTQSSPSPPLSSTRGLPARVHSQQVTQTKKRGCDRQPGCCGCCGCCGRCCWVRCVGSVGSVGSVVGLVGWLAGLAGWLSGCLVVCRVVVLFFVVLFEVDVFGACSTHCERAQLWHLCLTQVLRKIHYPIHLKAANRQHERSKQTRLPLRHLHYLLNEDTGNCRCMNRASTIVQSWACGTSTVFCHALVTCRCTVTVT